MKEWLLFGLIGLAIAITIFHKGKIEAKYSVWYVVAVLGGPITLILAILDLVKYLNKRKTR